jgi:hypothetical protein
MKKSKRKPSMSGMGLQDEKLQPGKEYMMAKGGAAKPTKAQKKVGAVMREFKAGFRYQVETDISIKNVLLHRPMTLL